MTNQNKKDQNVDILLSKGFIILPNIPPLNALRAFEASGRHLNFRLAAEELNVTQGAVAQHVRSLEATLGVQLFNRLPRGLEFTDDGRRFLAPIKKAFSLIFDAVDEIRPNRHSLKISVTPSFATKWLVPRLAKFAADNPDYDIDIVASNTLANFQSDGIDIAVRQGKPSFGPGLESELLFPTTYIPVCSPDLIDPKKPINQSSDLTHYLLLQDGHGLWPLFLETFGDEAISSSIRTINFNQAHLAIDAAIAGQGIALACDTFVQNELNIGTLIRPIPVNLNTDTGFYIVHPRRPRKSEYVTQLRDWMMGQSGFA